jgi:type IV pilus assembly protein PilC
MVQITRSAGGKEAPGPGAVAGKAAMLFSSRLPLSSLIELCRTLRHNLGAGLPLVDVWRQQARRGPLPVRPIAERISQQLAKGGDLEGALESEKAAFPPLFLGLATVAEQTGNLPEVFRELERYYVQQQRLRRQFLAQSAWPVIQFVAAIFVIAGMLFLLGIIAEIRGPEGVGGKPWDPLGLGLLGARGAAIFLGVVFGSLAALAGLYFLLTRGLRQQPRVDAFLLALPVIGPCLRALALARFCLALRLTLETGMSITRALRLSLRAAGNAAFADRFPVVKQHLEAGDELTVALAATGSLFPEDFRNILATAEEGGRLTEVLEHQTEHYQEEAGRRLTILTHVAGWAVWLVVAAFIITMIFRIVLSYISLIDELSQPPRM